VVIPPITLLASSSEFSAGIDAFVIRDKKPDYRHRPLRIAPAVALAIDLSSGKAGTARARQLLLS
jgi:hypothetical protein